MERKALEQKLTGFFEELHMHPELSYEEYETTERIKRELAALEAAIVFPRHRLSHYAPERP